MAGRRNTGFIHGVEADLKNDLKVAKKIRPPWWGLLVVFVAVLFGAFVFDHFGILAFEPAILTSVLTFGFTIAVKWHLRRSAWFWVVMGALAALHVPLILFLPWSKLIPSTGPSGPAMTLMTTADLIVMLSILDVVARVVKRPV